MERTPIVVSILYAYRAYNCNNILLSMPVLETRLLGDAGFMDQTPIVVKLHARFVQAQKPARFASHIFSIGQRQAKVVNGIHGDSCICDSIEWKDHLFLLRLVGVVLEAWKADDEVWKACRFI